MIKNFTFCFSTLLFIIFFLNSGCKRDKIQSLPIVTTSDIASITSVTALSGGSIISDGGDLITSYGVCWSTTPNPTVADNKTSYNKLINIFNSSIGGLYPNTTYYLRAYATNRIGTGYGSNKSFTTLLVTDYDGNVYNVVTIGEQLWLVENLKTTRYNDGSAIPLVTDNTAWESLSSHAYCFYNNDETNKDIYGALYNGWVIDTFTNGGKNVCPIGWHVSRDDEWTTMENYLIANGYNYDGTTDNDGDEATSNKIAKSLASMTSWNSSSNIGAVGNVDFSKKRNATGFTALPAGYRTYGYGKFGDIGNFTIWWSYSSDIFGYACRKMSFSNNFIYKDIHNKGEGFSIRCVRD